MANKEAKFKQNNLSPFGNLCKDPNVKANALRKIRTDFTDRTC